MQPEANIQNLKHTRSLVGNACWIFSLILRNRNKEGYFNFNVLIYALKGKLILAVEQMNCFMTLQYEFMWSFYGIQSQLRQLGKSLDCGILTVTIYVKVKILSMAAPGKISFKTIFLFPSGLFIIEESAMTLNQLKAHRGC
jgi:hypothetical protein